jgi:hypothetical protein
MGKLSFITLAPGGTLFNFLRIKLSRMVDFLIVDTYIQNCKTV